MLCQPVFVSFLGPRVHCLVILYVWKYLVSACSRKHIVINSQNSLPIPNVRKESSRSGCPRLCRTGHIFFLLLGLIKTNIILTFVVFLTHIHSTILLAFSLALLNFGCLYSYSPTSGFPQTLLNFCTFCITILFLF